MPGQYAVLETPSYEAKPLRPGASHVRCASNERAGTNRQLPSIACDCRVSARQGRGRSAGAYALRTRIALAPSSLGRGYADVLISVVVDASSPRAQWVDRASLQRYAALRKTRHVHRAGRSSRSSWTAIAVSLQTRHLSLTADPEKAERRLASACSLIGGTGLVRVEALGLASTLTDALDSSIGGLRRTTQTLRQAGAPNRALART